MGAVCGVQLVRDPGAFPVLLLWPCARDCQDWTEPSAYMQSTPDSEIQYQV